MILDSRYMQRSDNDAARACMFMEIGVLPGNGTRIYDADSLGAIQID